jgi:hypothetical protein
VSVFGSPDFSATFAIVLGLLLTASVLHERGKHNRSTLRRGVRSNDVPKLIIAGVGAGNAGGRGTYVHHVTTDPQAYAKAFVPADHKD